MFNQKFQVQNLKSQINYNDQNQKFENWNFENYLEFGALKL
jgi:hypothetical protein